MHSNLESDTCFWWCSYKYNYDNARGRGSENTLRSTSTPSLSATRCRSAFLWLMRDTANPTLVDAYLTLAIISDSTRYSCEALTGGPVQTTAQMCKGENLTTRCSSSFSPSPFSISTPCTCSRGALLCTCSRSLRLDGSVSCIARRVNKTS